MMLSDDLVSSHDGLMATKKEWEHLMQRRAESGSPCGTASSQKSTIPLWITHRSETYNFSSRTERLFFMTRSATSNPNVSDFPATLSGTGRPTPMPAVVT